MPIAIQRMFTAFTGELCKMERLKPVAVSDEIPMEDSYPPKMSQLGAIAGASEKDF